MSIPRIPSTPLAVLLLSITFSTTAVKADGQAQPLPDNPWALDAKKGCGPMCLTFLDRYFGNRHGYDEIVDLCPPGELGTSLEQVDSTARKLGYHTAAIRLNADQLKSLPFPAIVHLQSEDAGHFVVSLGWRGDEARFQIFNPPRALADQTGEWLAQRMSGLVLVVNDQPLPSADAMLSPSTNWSILLWRQLFAVALLAFVLTFVSGRRAARLEKGVVAPLIALLCWFALGCNGPEVADIRQVSASERDPSTADYGKIARGTAIQHTFRIVNTSDSPMRILSVEKSCACLAVAADLDREIAPGESTTVEVEVDTNALPGLLEKQFLVLTDSTDPEFSRIELTVRANVEHPLSALPSKVVFGHVGAGDSKTRTLHIRSAVPGLLESLQRVDSDSPHVTVVKRERSPGLLTFDVSLGNECPVGAVNGLLTFCFDHPKHNELAVQVVGRRAGTLTVIPRRLIVRASDITTQRRFRMRVSSAGKLEFRILAVRPPEGIHVDWSPRDEPGRSFDLVVQVRGEPTRMSEIALETDVESQPVVAIPLLLAAPAGPKSAEAATLDDLPADSASIAERSTR